MSTRTSNADDDDVVSNVILKMAGIIYGPRPGSLDATASVKKAKELLEALRKDRRIVGQNVFAAAEVAASIFAATSPGSNQIDGVLAKTVDIVEALYAQGGKPEREAGKRR